MKIRYFYQWNYHAPVYGNPPYLRFGAQIMEGEEANIQKLDKYLLSAIATDFSLNRFGKVDETLQAIQRIAMGEIKEFDTGGEGFCHHLTNSSVRFEHNTFGECPDWPIWCCTLAQYKAALLGYRQFLDMPRSIDTELIIELPDGEPEKC